LLGLSTSGLTVHANKGENVLYDRSAAGMAAGDIVRIGTGTAEETRTIASVTIPPTPQAPTNPIRFGRRGLAGQNTVWQPRPVVPVITIPAGSINMLVTGVDGFEVGQKVAIGYGATYPAVAMAVEKYEVVTITAVGKPGTQAWLSMDARAG